jgi:hypothetical protein
VRFRKIGGNLYAVELIGHDLYMYGYMQILSADGSKVFVHFPKCETFKTARIEKLGVKFEKENNKAVGCYVPSIEVLGTLIKNYINDPKNAKTIESSKGDGTFIVITK